MAYLATSMLQFLCVRVSNEQYSTYKIFLDIWMFSFVILLCQIKSFPVPPSLNYCMKNVKTFRASSQVYSQVA